MAKKFRILALALIFSGALNIGFVAVFLFYHFKASQISFPSSRSTVRSASESTNSQLFSTMSKYSFRELVSFLTNRDLVEEGYTKRDLAVAALVAFHSFHLEKALSAPPTQVRTVQIAENQKIEIYPGLSEEQFQAIIRFAYQEKWPLTTKGLFQRLEKKGERDPSLEQAFILTPEFYALQMLFQKTESPQESQTLLDLVCEGSWDLLERLAREQAQIVDFSVDKRRQLLLGYIAQGSRIAAQLLLRTDSLFALKRLEDRAVLDLLSLLNQKSEEGTQFCLSLLRSARNDAIWQAAAKTLYAFAGESVEEPINPRAALAHFTGEKPPSIPVIPKVEARFHVVKEGESLWKISRLYKVPVDEIVKYNGLEKDSLYPGMTLKLPQGTGSEPPR